MWGRRSMTRTRLFSCVATRSAIVRPKNPEPTTRRSKRAVIGSKGIRPLSSRPNPTRAAGCDRLTIPYRHFRHRSNTSTVDHVGTDGLQTRRSVTADGDVHEYLPHVVHILRRLPCRTDVDAGSRQPRAQSLPWQSRVQLQ